ncbi:MAG: TonB-dependent receptor, partial [Gammaproteobacteria bacterium]|nr:TonB-dependent receptor [Gammaproteobacteria bacterium]
MRVKSNKSLRTRAHLASASPVLALPLGAPPWSWTGPRTGATTTVAAAVAAILYGVGGNAYAQEAAPAATSATAPDSLQEVVVTATATGVKKLDASYSIVSVDQNLIKEANPKSTADLLKVSPGIWPESSGGQTGANIEVAGFPSGGDAPFFTNMIEGMPLYGMPSLSFMDSSSLFRLDDTVDRVEVVQGGPGALYGPGQMGATANFILKRGTDQTTGSVGMTYGNEGLWRLDSNVGFKIADGWYGALGGFYRESNGVRSPQFPADKGGQFTASLNHDLEGGSLFVWGRVLDDKNQFIVPVPVIQSPSGTSFSGYPGFCPLKCSFGSWNIQNVTLPNPAGGFEDANLANGRGGNLYYFGVKYNQHFGNLEVLNNLILNGGGLDTNALFSGPNPRPLGVMLYGCQAVPGYTQPGQFCTGGVGGTPVDLNNYGIDPKTGLITYPNAGGPGTGLPVGYNVQATYSGSGVPVPLSQDVIQQGWWYIQKSLSNFADELRLNWTLFEGNTLTGGVYFAKYSMNDNWSLGNQMLMTTTPNARAINLQYLTGATCTTPGTGNICHLTSNQGFLNWNNNYNILQHGNATNIAGYLSDSWRIGGFLFDAGARLENIDVHYRGSGAAYSTTQTHVALGTPFDLWNNNVVVSNGLWAYEHYTTTRPTFTGGINYEFSDHASIYVRANTGNHFNDFDNGVRGASGKYAPTQTITNYEGGLKFQTSWLYADLGVYKRDFTGLQYQETNAAGIGTGVISTYGSTAKGVNFTGTVTPFQNFVVRLIADYMDGHYTDYVGCAPYIDIFGHNQCAQINGAPIQRQPKWHLQATPSYTIPFADNDLTAFVTYEYVGQRYEDITGLQPLGTYYLLSAGVVANVGRHWQFRVQGSNLTNQIGLTEGNARKTGQAAGIGGVLLARPIEGQEINFTA